MSESLAEFTTMRVGGPARELVRASDEAGLVEAVRSAWDSHDEWLVLGGGSNVVIADEGFDGTVVKVETRGIEESRHGDGVRLRVQAGESWDALVAHAVERGWAGIEALSGIPGTVGAAPMQNIGAYGQELAETLIAIDLLDHVTGEVVRVPAEGLELGYRTSALKHGERVGVVVAVELDLQPGADGVVAYPQLASALGVRLGDRVPLARIRDGVLALRASKGMVLDAADPDTFSCGSFFTNPIVAEAFARTLPADAPRWPLYPEPEDVVVPLEEYAFPEDGPTAPVPDDRNDRPAVPLGIEGNTRNDVGSLREPQGAGSTQGAEPRMVKLSAAWLIEHSGIGRGFALPGSRAAISSKHTLAITNRGGANAAQVAELARFVRSRVAATLGVELQPEPIGVGVEL
jgi:UDP-N-acetylmuramate dehydrogenase